jgi:hypothetical protein
MEIALNRILFYHLSMVIRELPKSQTIREGGAESCGSSNLYCSNLRMAFNLGVF